MTHIPLTPKQRRYLLKLLKRDAYLSHDGQISDTALELPFAPALIYVGKDSDKWIDRLSKKQASELIQHLLRETASA